MSPLVSSTNHDHFPEEWVEIVEPKSKKRIYANLEAGICANHAPDGAIVSRAEDYAEQWWELHDQRTGKFYYYNPDQQKTVWTKPTESTSSNGSQNHKKILIIPVSRLQTSSGFCNNEPRSNKRDASTQTIASDLVSIGTQTTSSENSVGQYLLNEARAAGISLASYDGLDDEEDSCDDDKITDSHDDAMSDHCDVSDLNDTQELVEDSGDGWRTHSDLGATSCKAPLEDTSELSQNLNSFKIDDLIDDKTDPTSFLSQQLDHRKLVDNFKKTRQTSSFGPYDSMSRAYKLDTNIAVQRIKNVAESYFNHDREPVSDRQLRQLSTLSTLPRPPKGAKERFALSKPDNEQKNVDADYDIVEENCGYHSDSGRIQAYQQHSNMSACKFSDFGVGLQSTKVHFDRNKNSRGSTFSVESFARENLTRHPKKGGLLFNRKEKWSRMISWTKSSIKQPMISSVVSDLNSDAILSFKLIQQYMGDRKITNNKRYRQILASVGSKDDSEEKHTRLKNLNSSGSTSSYRISSEDHIPDRLRDELAYDLVVIGCSRSALRDEIYVQLARQLTENPSQDSVGWGLVLMSIFLSYFSPSDKFSPFLSSFLECHAHQMSRDVCLPRLEKRLIQNWTTTYCRKPANGKEISIVRLSITRWPQYCGVFGESLERIMILQKCSPYLRTLRLPWIITTLGDKLLEGRGAETEGIFRCAADHDLIAQLRLEIDCIDFRKIADAKQVHSLLLNVRDPHVIASLLKLFFRQLQDPIFPTQIYNLCIQSCQDVQSVCQVFNDHLPNLNKDVVAYLIRLLQLLASSEKVAQTKMDSSNLSMVWAPNLLRSPNQGNVTILSSKCGSKWSISNVGSDDHNQSTPSQSLIFEQTRQEMQFIKTLIIHLDTSFIENVI